MPIRISPLSANPGSDRRRRALWLASALALGVWGPSAVAWGADRVVLQKPGSSGRVVVEGKIEDFSASGLELKPAGGGPVQQYSTAEVLEFETPRTQGHSRGLALWQDGDVTGAAEQFEFALKQEPRLWVRRDILAELVRCAVRSGDYATGGTRFLALWKSDPGSRHLRVIPLVWAPEVINSAARNAARGWLNGSSDTARLLGASLLLFDKEHDRAAQTALRELARESASSVGLLALWQSRRRELVEGNLSPGDLAFWERDLSELAADLRAGPCFLLGQALATRHEYELAAAYWMRLPIQGDDDYRLTARATLEAGRALARIGQTREAQTLFLEAANRFEGTTSSREARDLLAAPKQPAVTSPAETD